MLPQITLLGCTVKSYDILTMIAVMVGFIYFSLALWKLNIKLSQIVLFVFLGGVVQYVGGVLIPFAYIWIYQHQMPWWNIWGQSPGRFFHSVILSMIAFTLIYGKVFKWPTKKVLDSLVIALILASSIGRIGCWLEGCCGGKTCDLPWAVVFPSHPEARAHPTQIYMFFLETVLWIYLLFFNSKKKRYDGQTFWVGVFLYSTYRIIIEFFRINPVFIFGLTHAQVFSILTLILAFWVLRAQKQTQK